MKQAGGEKCQALFEVVIELKNISVDLNYLKH